MSIRTVERATTAPHRWTWLYSAALFGHTAVNSGASSVLTPQLVSRVDEAHKVVLLGMISATWGVVSLVGAPLIGALSDRTTSPRGRRHPWILAGALGTSAALVAMAQQTEPIGLILLAVPAAVFPLMMTNGLTATLVDDVPPARRATVSGWANGVATCMGLLGGTALVSVAFTGLTTGCLVSAILVLVLVVPFACLTAAHGRIGRTCGLGSNSAPVQTSRGRWACGSAPGWPAPWRLCTTCSSSRTRCVTTLRRKRC